MRTTDLGITWTRVGSPPQDVNLVVPDPVALQILFAAGTTGIYKSADGGNSWRRVWQFQQFQPGLVDAGDLVIDPGNHLRLAATVPFGGGLIRSLDGGETWTPATSCAVTDCRGRLWADPTGSGALVVGSIALFISRDWGVTFQALKPPGSPGRGVRSSAAFDPSHPGWIYVSTSITLAVGSLALSTDFGATWTAKATPSPPLFSRILSLAVDPDQPETLVALTQNGTVHKSTDGASSWSLQPGKGSPQTGLPFNPAADLRFIILSHKCSPDGGLFAAGRTYDLNFSTYQIAFSPDDGASWLAPHLTRITSVSAGAAACSVYITRELASDAFVAKLAPDGTTLWATYMGGSDEDVPVALVVDPQGNAYVAGNTTSPDFPSSVPRIGVPGQRSVFVTKFLPDGSLGYSVTLGGDATNAVTALASDARGNIYVVCSTTSTNFPVTSGTVLTSRTSLLYTGFLVKLSSGAALVYGTYLGAIPGAILVDADNQPIIAANGLAPGLPPPPFETNPDFVMKLDQAASQVISAVYIEGSEGYGMGPSALATDGEGNLIVAGRTFDNVLVNPRGYVSPESPSAVACPTGNYSSYIPRRTYIVKLAASDWRPIYRSLLTSSCGMQLGVIAVDSTGAIVLGLAAGAGLPMRHPLLGAPSCSTSSSAVVKLSPDGAELQFATYLDNCGVPGVALARDGSVYVGVSPSLTDTASGVLHLSTAASATFSLDQISNAFSGDAGQVVGGGLYSLTVSGLQLPAIDLGINAREDLPGQLGGVRVTFDDTPASILRMSQGQLIVASPANLPVSSQGVALTSIQVFYNGVPSNAVRMPVYSSAPGLLTRDIFDPIYRGGFADGYVQNEDAALNDATHPAAAGSTITVFATGMGATNPPVVPGSIATSLNVTPVVPLYSSWTSFFFPRRPPPKSSIPCPASSRRCSRFQSASPLPLQILGLKWEMESSVCSWAWYFHYHRGVPASRRRRPIRSACISSSAGFARH